jgi:hypothetical protein
MISLGVASPQIQTLLQNRCQRQPNFDTPLIYYEMDISKNKNKNKTSSFLVAPASSYYNVMMFSMKVSYLDVYEYIVFQDSF